MVNSCRSSRHDTPVSTKTYLGYQKAKKKNIDKELQKSGKIANQESMGPDVDVDAAEEGIGEEWGGSTVRQNRKNLPEDLKQSSNLKKERTCKGQVTAYRWYDTKDVHLLSNCHDPTETAEVSRKLTNGSTLAVMCPKAVADYNLWMGAIDRFDQKRNSYTADRRSMKSWYRIFYFLFDTSVVNAFITAPILT
ncbi:hypothetical protein HPB50_004639 [Hyalomma asiaticum]|uniref:Uncharacterized protein n=1 Tax=Hyalomma asiaticum TaxID=266040 RepID=A0ACB7SE05_HYAAI|nr:hypothetical protein HPB50_004639 [Hyalomma asiaticum]